LLGMEMACGEQQEKKCEADKFHREG